MPTRGTNISGYQTKTASLESEDQLRFFETIINNVPGAVVRFELMQNGNHRFIYVSEQAENLWNVKNKDVLDNWENLWNEVYTADRDEFSQTLLKSSESQNIWTYEWRMHAPDGRLRWLKGKGTPVKTDHSTIWDTIILDVTDRKENELALKNKTKILERTEELVKMGSWEYIAATDQLYWSDEIYKIFEHDVKNQNPIPYEKLIERVVPETLKTLKVERRKALKHGGSYQAVIHHQNTSGGIKYCLVSGMVTLDSQGKLETHYGSIQDITSRKLIEIDLKSNQEMLQNIADNIPGMVLRYLQKDFGQEEVLFISKGAIELFQIEEDSIKNNLDSCRQRIHPEDFESYKKSMLEAAEDLSFWNEEFRLKMPDGQIKWIHGRGRPQKLLDGDILWDVIVLDITDQKEAIDNIRSLKEQLDLAIHTANLGVWKVDLINNKMIWSDEVLEIYGLTREWFNENQKDWKNYVHPEDFLEVQDAANRAALGEQTVRVTFRVIRPSGEIRHVIASASPYFVHGKIGGIIGINLDVSDFKKIEEDLRKAKELAEENEQKVISKNKELEKANQELDNFVYRVSHDLRSPITSSIGLSQISLRSNNIDEVHHYDQLRISSLKKLDNFIKEILNYSRNSRLPVAYEPIDFQETIDKILLEHQGTIQEQNIEVRIEINEDGEFRGDKMRINTILDNLLSNAFKFVNAFKERHFVKIHVNANNNYAKIDVIDNGIGIREERQEKIYEMFYRANDTHSGTGIGLYILKECLEKVDGQIQLYSKAGEGSTFKIHIPTTIQ